MLSKKKPPPQEFFDAERPAAGSQRVGIRLGELALEIHGLDEALAGALATRYAPYADRETVGVGAVDIRFGLEEIEYFIDPPATPRFNEVRLEYDVERKRVRYLGYRVAGWFDVDGGNGVVLLARGSFEPPVSALENYVRSCVAWQAATRGGALVHAASAIWQDGGYLFYGESGAGKSTLCENTRRARVVTDDLSLLLPDSDGALKLIGSPFRGTYTGGEPVEGAYPVRAGFRLLRGDRPEVREVPRVRALSEFVGNLPFVAESFTRRPDLFASIHEAMAPIPLAHLYFTRDDRYWDAIEASGIGRPGGRNSSIG